MIAEFEKRLADVLGARLPDPFRGQVRVAPGDGPAALPALTLGVVSAERLTDDLGGAPPLVAPGAPLPRRVVAMRCRVAVEVRAGAGQGRPQQVVGVGAALDAFESADMRRGAALAGGAPDPGFLIHLMDVAGARLPLRPGEAPAGEGPVEVELVAEGIFWPVGAVGQSGVPIGEVRLRGATLPIAVELAESPQAGGAPIAVTVRVGTAALDLRAGQPPAALPFDRLAVGLRGPGGRPGAGVVQGGTAGAGDVRLALLRDGVASLDYAPPAAPARDELVVALDDGTGGIGVELGGLVLEVRG